MYYGTYYLFYFEEDTQWGSAKSAKRMTIPGISRVCCCAVVKESVYSGRRRFHHSKNIFN